MRKKYNDYIGALDQIRKDKHITIAKLTEGIVSERTYRRYVSHDTSLNLTVLLQLAERLKIKVSDMIFYLIHTKNSSLEFKDFLIALYQEKTNCPKKSYTKIKNYKNQYDEVEILVHALVLKYDSIKEKTNKQIYLDYLKANLPRFIGKNSENIYVLCFLTLYLEEFPENENVNIDFLLEQFTKDYTHKQRAILYLIATDIILKLLEKEGDVSRDNYEEVVELFSLSAYIIKDMRFITDGNLHKAILYYRLNKQVAFEEHLFKYLMGRIVIREEHEFDGEKYYLGDLFEMNITQFQIEYAKKVLKM